MEQKIGDIEHAIAEFYVALPGWWLTIGSCYISRDASCGPDRNGPDADLLVIPKFDEGFNCYDRNPESTMAGSIRCVMLEGVIARIVATQQIRNDAEHAIALSRISDLMDAEVDTPDGEELDALAEVVSAYEDEHYPMECAL